jgi:tellurite methyltransferase
MKNSPRAPSVAIFDRQFQQQIQGQDFSLNPFEVVALDYLKGSILDFGSGLGNLALEAGRRGHQVLAVDASATAVAHINAEAARQKLAVQAIEADFQHWQINKPYDTIVSIGLLSYFGQAQAHALLHNIQAQVKPGGHAIINLLIEGTTYFDLFGDGDYYLPPPNLLEQSFAGWTIRSACLQNFDAPNGTCKKFSTVIAQKPIR